MPLYIHGIGATLSEKDGQKADLSSLADNVDPNVLRRLPHFCKLGLQASLQAIEDCPRALLPERTGLIVATAFGPARAPWDFFEAVNDLGPMLASPLAFSHSVHNAAAGVISIQTGISGPSLTISQQAMSFNSALLTAKCWLADSVVDVVILGVVEEYDSTIAHVVECTLDQRAMEREGAVFFVVNCDPEAKYGKLELLNKSVLAKEGVDEDSSLHSGYIVECMSFLQSRFENKRN